MKHVYEKDSFIPSNSRFRENHTITAEKIEYFRNVLAGEGKSKQVAAKYERDLRKLQEFLKGCELTQERLEEYKKWLTEEKNYKTRSVNSFIGAINKFCTEMGWEDLGTRYYRLPHDGHVKIEEALSVQEYESLIKTALEHDVGTALLIQVLAETDLRVTDLAQLDISALDKGHVEVKRGAGIVRIELPECLLEDLRWYASEQHTEGILFHSCHGNLSDRSLLLSRLKNVGRLAGISDSRVTFRNLKRPMRREYFRLRQG